MQTGTLANRLFLAVQTLLLGAMITAAALLSRPEEWHPFGLLALLLALALAGERFTVEYSGGALSASLAVMVLAMGLLGPAPAAACGIAAMTVHSAVGRRRPDEWLNNLAAFGIAAYAGGWVIQAAEGNVSAIHAQGTADSVIFGLVVLTAVVVLLVVNFGIFATSLWVRDGRSILRSAQDLFFPLLPGELAVGVVAVVLVLTYRGAGIPALLAAIPVLLIFRHLAVALVRSESRAEELDARTRQLASFQWAVPSTFMEGLGLRDPGAMRHAAAVASYSKAMASELGLAEEEQEMIHLSGLLHDIGKFTWSDRILHPEKLTDADWAVIRRHPQDGAMMVGKFDGFGPVADAILYHHERMDGGGYPAGLIGNEIPLASRIVAICSTYDTMLRRQTYGERISPEEAIEELRRIAGSQLDGELVDVFITVLEKRGRTFGQDADYKTELALENRVRKMAQPHSS
jgi:putative nucleotidyltransferase with HDIG domain